MRKFWILLGIGCSMKLVQPAIAIEKEWTWFYKKVITAPKNDSSNTVSYTKINVPYFNQLIVSWNAVRPTQGSFTFYGRVRNAQTKEWGKWHKMASWGKDTQRSYLSDSDGFSSHHYVRLEILPHIMADGFSIKAKADTTQQVNLLKSVGVCLSNIALFNAESAHHIQRFNSTLVKGLPRYCQFELDHPRNDGLCSPTSCAMLASYLVSHYIDPLQFAESAYDCGLEKYGSWPFNMAHAFELCGGKVHFWVKRLPSCKDLYESLSLGIPVVVSVRGSLEGAPRPYTNGHLLVVIGFDKKTKEFICHDPAVDRAPLVKKRYPAQSFLAAWERSHRLSYIAEPLL